MSITPTNQSKNVVTPQGARKTGIYFWGDSIATWGDAIATWGGVMITPTNQTKNGTTSGTLAVGSPIGLLLTLTYAVALPGVAGVVNQSKS